MDNKKDNKKDNVFYLKKEDAKKFQNQCLIAIFLETHEDVKFKEYVEINKFKGIIDNCEKYIYLFETPKQSSEPGCVYRSKNRETAHWEHEYKLFSPGFIEEYKKYREDVYGYMMEHFFDYWGKYDNLFISEKPKEDEVFKYKQFAGEKDKEGNMKLGQYFEQFLDGMLVFSNPITFNDPFDCDCELPDLDSIKCLLWNAFNSIKYSGCGSTSVKKRDIEAVLKKMDLNIVVTKDDKSGNAKDNLEEVIRAIIDEGNKDDKEDMREATNPKTIETIEKTTRRMYGQVNNLKERFRVFCTGKKANDILMWGYYCDGGNGVCCQYNSEDIVSSIEECFQDKKPPKNAICVYGNVSYYDDKPKYEYKQGDPVDNIWEYVIKCVFTKYEGWKHEDEFRYVLMKQEFENDYISIPSKIQDYYLGCKLDSPSTESIENHIGKKYHQIKKSKNKYELICD